MPPRLRLIQGGLSEDPQARRAAEAHRDMRRSHVDAAALWLREEPELPQRRLSLVSSA